MPLLALLLPPPLLLPLPLAFAPLTLPLPSLPLHDSRLNGEKLCKDPFTVSPNPIKFSAITVFGIIHLQNGNLSISVFPSFSLPFSLKLSLPLSLSLYVARSGVAFICPFNCPFSWPFICLISVVLGSDLIV